MPCPVSLQWLGAFCYDALCHWGCRSWCFPSTSSGLRLPLITATVYFTFTKKILQGGRETLPVGIFPESCPSQFWQTAGIWATVYFPLMPLLWNTFSHVWSSFFFHPFFSKWPLQEVVPRKRTNYPVGCDEKKNKWKGRTKVESKRGINL